MCGRGVWSAYSPGHAWQLVGDWLLEDRLVALVKHAQHLVVGGPGWRGPIIVDWQRHHVADLDRLAWLWSGACSAFRAGFRTLAGPCRSARAPPFGNKGL